MKTAREIRAEVKEILASAWQRREGRQVPQPEDLRLGNDAVILKGTVLYADMADSTGLVDGYLDSFAAEVYKSYLISACHIIKNNGGEITAFDGDRVMAVYSSDTKNSSAAKSALQINWAVGEINTALRSQYENTAFQLKHAVGIDTSELFIARTGVRNANDLVWVGRAANYAAKLAGMPGSSYGVYITHDVFKKLSDDAKFGGNPRKLMWEQLHWSDQNMTIHKSTWTWEP